MARFAVDVIDFALALLRPELEPDGIAVMSRIPDGVPSYTPLVVVRRSGGDSVAPEFYDEPYLNIQCWCDYSGIPGTDQYRDADNLADRVRGILWRAWRSQKIVNGACINKIRESSSPREIGDPDLVLTARVVATYDIRIRGISTS